MSTPSPSPIYQEHLFQQKHYRKGGHLPWFLPWTILGVVLVFLVVVAIAAWPRRRSTPVPAAAADPQPVMPPPEELNASYPPSPASEAGALNEVEMTQPNTT